MAYSDAYATWLHSPTDVRCPRSSAHAKRVHFINLQAWNVLLWRRTGFCNLNLRMLMHTDTRSYAVLLRLSLRLRSSSACQRPRVVKCKIPNLASSQHCLSHTVWDINMYTLAVTSSVPTHKDWYCSENTDPTVWVKSSSSHSSNFYNEKYWKLVRFIEHCWVVQTTIKKWSSLHLFKP